jgi:hypothetical protein
MDRKSLEELIENAWTAPAEFTELRVGGRQLPNIVDLADGGQTQPQNCIGWRRQARVSAPV